MVGCMNSDILGSVVTFSEGVEKKLERTAEIISINKKRNILILFCFKRYELILIYLIPFLILLII